MGAWRDQVVSEPLRVLLLSQYLDHGGGARATQRIFDAMNLVAKETGVIPHLHAVRGEASSVAVSTGFPGRSLFWRFWFWVRVHFSRIAPRWLFRPEQPSLHSTASVATGLLDSVPGTWDVVHLNWLSDATVSIEEIGKTQLPVVWTLHDMWPYCGAEHQTLSPRFVEGYHLQNRPAVEKGPDINRRTWLRKKKAWKSLPTVVAPSHWSALNARQSALLGAARIEEIPHPLDTAFWAPGNSGGKNRVNPDTQRVIRLGLPAPQVSKEWGKGLHWVENILERVLEGTALSSTLFELWVFGGRNITLSNDRISVKQCGWLNDEGLRDFYRDIDLLVFPSAIDTFGMVAAEAQSCGTPVVCFQDTGVESVVGHETTGYTATYGDLQDFAEGVLWCVDSPERLARLSEKSRERALELWDMKTIGHQYAALFRQVVDRSLERPESQ